MAPAARIRKKTPVPLKNAQRLFEADKRKKAKALQLMQRRFQKRLFGKKSYLFEALEFFSKDHFNQKVSEMVQKFMKMNGIKEKKIAINAIKSDIRLIRERMRIQSARFKEQYWGKNYLKYRDLNHFLDSFLFGHRAYLFRLESVLRKI